MDGCPGLDLVIKSTPENHELSLNPLFLPASCLSKLKGGNHTSPGGIWQFSGNVLATWWASEGYATWIYAGTCDFRWTNLERSTGVRMEELKLLKEILSTEAPSGPSSAP